jgi:hypothetical protein
MLNIYLGYVAKLGTDIAPAVRKVSQQAPGARAAQVTRDAVSAGTATRRDQESRPTAG